MSVGEEMFLFVADISGYTEYMLTNQKAINHHAEMSIALLIETLIKQTKFPIEISKLEGDAIFFYLKKKLNDPLWLSEHLLTFFQVFEQKLQELKISNVCSCGACQNIDQLQLKMIVHYGRACIQKIGRFQELTGIDVIVVHRLLKNHIPKKRYLLLTEQAYQKMLLPAEMKISKAQETYDVGTLSLYVCDPPPIDLDSLPKYDTFYYTLKRWVVGLIFLYLIKLGLKKPGKYHNLPKK